MDSFFGIGPLEFVFILIFALIFLGPERLPTVVRQIAQFITQVRELSSQITEQLNEEFGDLKELDPRWQIEQLAKETETDKKKSSKKAGSKASSKATPARPPTAAGQNAAKTGAAKSAQAQPKNTEKTGSASDDPAKSAQPAQQPDPEEAPQASVNGAAQSNTASAPLPDESGSASTPSQPGPDDQVSPASQYFLEQQRAAESSPGNASAANAALESEDTPEEENTIAPPNLPEKTASSPKQEDHSGKQDGQVADTPGITEQEPETTRDEEDQT